MGRFLPLVSMMVQQSDVFSRLRHQLDSDLDAVISVWNRKARRIAV